jgi:hypothetical protein
MTELEKLKLHLSNCIDKEQQDVVLNVKWLLQILDNINDKPNKDGKVETVDVDGGQF